MKKKTLKNTAKPKSRAEKFHDMEKLFDIPDFRQIAEKFDVNAVERKIFQKSVVFKRMKNGKDGKTFICDDSCETLTTNDPQYIGFGKLQQGRLTTIPEAILRHFGHNLSFIGWQACAFLAEHNFIYKACSMPGEDALGCGYSVVPRGTKGAKKLMPVIEEILEDPSIGLDDSMRKFEFNKRCFGFAVAVPCFEEDVDMSIPLKDYMQLKGKHFLGWAIIDPYWLNPVFDEDAERNPSHKRYFKPTWWKVNGRNKMIHYTWMVSANNTMMADVTAPTYMWGGVSIPQLCYERVYCADKCANEAQMVAMSKRLVAITGCNTRKMAANPEYARRTMEAFELNRDNWGAIALGSGQDIKQLDTYITEFNQLITTQYQLFCGIVEVPSPKMMMTPLTGFASKGDFEWKVYAANQKKIQKYDYTPMIKMTYRMIAATLGFDERFSVEWGKIDIPTLAEESEIIYNDARSEKFKAEAEAVKKMAAMKSAEMHKGVVERVSK